LAELSIKWTVFLKHCGTRARQNMAAHEHAALLGKVKTGGSLFYLMVLAATPH
jgi:hypothetical protein